MPEPSTNTVLTTEDSSDARESIHLVIRNTKKTVFDEHVKSITSLNEKGEFDVLPLHENFISLIQKHIKIHKMNGDTQTMEIQNGVVYITRNEVKCYIDLLSASQTNPPQPTEAPVRAQPA